MNKNIAARISLTAGIVGLILITIFNIDLIINFQSNYVKTNLFLEFLLPFFYKIAWFFDILGIFFGFLALNSNKKKSAKIGIVLSILGLFSYLLFFFLLWARFGGI